MHAFLPRTRPGINVGGDIPRTDVGAMIDLIKDAISKQFEASMSMLESAIENCPGELWNKPVAQLQFCQAAFHTLFFTDLYLGPDLDSLQTQEFHSLHANVFAGYEEFEDRPQQKTYSREFIEEYFRYCRSKAEAVIPAETEASLAQRSGFFWLKFSRAEVYLYNIRHIHHHAAQLSLWLKSQGGEGVNWVKSGWSNEGE